MNKISAFLAIFALIAGFADPSFAAPPQLEILGQNVAPNLSGSGTGSIYFDLGTHQLMLSQNGGAYQALSGSSIPAPISITTPYTANSIGGPGTFIGNTSSSDQTNKLAVFGSTDTSSNTDSSSNVYMVSGDLLGGTLSGATVGSVVLQGGSVVNDASGSGVSAGSITLNGGNALDGFGGGLNLNGGNSSSNGGGQISLVGGVGLTNGGGVVITGGSSNGSNGGVVSLTAGDAAVGPGGSVTIASGTGAGPAGPGAITFSTGVFNRVTISAKGSLDQNAPQSTLSGSAGSAICSQPNQGATYKKVIVYMSGYTDTGTRVYTFPTPFLHVPFVSGLAAVVSGASVTTSTVAFTVTAQTGFITLEGF